MSPAQAYDQWSQSISESRMERVSVSDSFRLSAWVYGSITIIASAVSNAPFVTTSRGTPALDSPLAKLVAQPNLYDQQSTSTKFRNAYLTEILLNGAAMKVFPGIDGDVPGSVVTLPRWKFYAQDADDEIGRMFVRKWQYRGRTRAPWYVPGLDIYHDALYNPYHDYEGLSPLEAATIGISNDVHVGEFADRFFQNDGSTGIVFTSDHPGFRQEQADLAGDRWRQKYSGTKRAFMPKFVGFGLTPHKLGAPFDAKMMQVLRTLTKEEIVTGVFKIPLEVFGSSSDTGDGVTIGAKSSEPAKETFLVNVVIPWARRYDDDWNRDVSWRFGPQFECRHDFDQHPILERRRLERAKAAAELIDHGVPLNAVIDWLALNLDHQPWGDDFWLDNSKTTAAILMSVGERAFLREAAEKRPASKGQAADAVLHEHDSVATERQRAIAEHLSAIARLSQTAEVKNGVRADPARRLNGKHPANRIAELLGEMAAS